MKHQNAINLTVAIEREYANGEQYMADNLPLYILDRHNWQDWGGR